MSSVVLDASALIAMLRQEPGEEVVSRVIDGAILSAVNAAEVYGKAREIGLSREAVVMAIGNLPLRIVPFDNRQAKVASVLRDTISIKGISLADRCCLALGIVENLPVLTADRAWAQCQLDIDVRVIR